MFGPYADSNPPSPGTPSGGSTNYLQGLSQQSGISLGGSPSGSGTDFFPYVYAGPGGKTTGASSANAAEYRSENPDSVKRILDMQNRFMQSGNENIHHWAYLLALAGYKGSMTEEQAAEYARMAPMNDVFEMHLNFLKDAGNLFHAGQKLTPNQYLKKLLDYRLGDKWDGKLNSLDPNGGGDGSKTSTSTTKSVDLMSNEDAKSLVRATLQQELGRDPTQAEYEDFVATLHSAERRNPSISTSTVTTDGNGNSTQSVRTRGGLSQAGAEQALYEELRDRPSWGIWQAVGQYAPALFAALDSAVPGT